MVKSETKTLQSVILHRPGKELSILNEGNKKHFLFDEVPDYTKAIKEHEVFSNILKDKGVEVLYIEDLMVEVLDKYDVREELIKEYLKDADCNDESIYNYLLNIKDNKELVNKLIEGVGDIEPLVNLYFTRDAFTLIGDGIALYNMNSNLRNREVIFGRFINKYLWKKENYFDYNLNLHMEGGDVLVVSDELLLVGVSERTGYEAAKHLANNVFKYENSYKYVLTINFGEDRSCMHLDTIMTMIDDHTFVYYKDRLAKASLKLITREEEKILDNPIEETLSTLMHKDIEFITCGNKDNAALEQWNDACNTLCIKPNEIIVYDINKTTNAKYIDKGCVIHYIPSNELLKGRGGPHCMSMPFNREN